MVRRIGLPRSVTEEGKALNILVDDLGDTTYVGYSLYDSDTSAEVWKIKKITESGNITIILNADGNDYYDNVWDNRESLSYS